MTDELQPDELATIAADDALLDLVAGGAQADADLGPLLSSWRRELDIAADAVPSGVPDVRRRPRWRRHVAGGAAVVIVLAASTGAAAAASGPGGPLGPLNTFLFGPEAPHRLDIAVIRASAALDGVESAIEAARAAGGITDQHRAVLLARLDQVGRVVDAEDDAPDSLATRVERLRHDVDALPALPTSQPADDGTADDHRGRGGSDDGSSESGGDGTRDDSSSGTSSDDGGEADDSGGRGVEDAGGSADDGGSDDGNARNSDDGGSGRGGDEDSDESDDGPLGGGAGDTDESDGGDVDDSGDAGDISGGSGEVDGPREGSDQATFDSLPTAGSSED
jgi:hypothetical protein